MNKNFSLIAGERIRLEDGEHLALIESGKVEVYTVTRAEGSFRQQFHLASCRVHWVMRAVPEV